MPSLGGEFLAARNGKDFCFWQFYVADSIKSSEDSKRFSQKITSNTEVPVIIFFLFLENRMKIPYQILRE